jgi:hypothetical protein
MHTLRITRQPGSTTTVGVRGLDRAEGVAQSLMATDRRVTHIGIEDQTGAQVVGMVRTDDPAVTRADFGRHADQVTQ